MGPSRFTIFYFANGLSIFHPRTLTLRLRHWRRLAKRARYLGMPSLVSPALAMGAMGLLSIVENHL